MKYAADLTIASISLAEMFEAIPPMQVACMGAAVIVTTKNQNSFKWPVERNLVLLRGITSIEDPTQRFKTPLTSPLCPGCRRPQPKDRESTPVQD